MKLLTQQKIIPMFCWTGEIYYGKRITSAPGQDQDKIAGRNQKSEVTSSIPQEVFRLTCKYDRKFHHSSDAQKAHLPAGKAVGRSKRERNKLSQVNRGKGHNTQFEAQTKAGSGCWQGRRVTAGV